MSTEVKPTDWDAEDNRWEPTPSGGGGGGSALPPYTSADKGKVLTIGEDAEHPITDVVVPEQTVTENYGPLTTTLPYTDVVTMCNNSTPCVLTLDGYTYNETFEWYYFGGDENTPCIKFDTGPNSYVAVTFINDNRGSLWYTDGGPHTVSVSLSAPTVAPVWENAGGGDIIGFSTATTNAIMQVMQTAIPTALGGSTAMFQVDLTSIITDAERTAVKTACANAAERGKGSLVSFAGGVATPTSYASDTGGVISFLIPNYSFNYSSVQYFLRITLSINVSNSSNYAAALGFLEMVYKMNGQ